MGDLGVVFAGRDGGQQQGIRLKLSGMSENPSPAKAGSPLKGRKNPVNITGFQSLFREVNA